MDKYSNIFLAVAYIIYFLKPHQPFFMYLSLMLSIHTASSILCLLKSLHTYFFLVSPFITGNFFVHELVCNSVLNVIYK